jgi:hypothetical protein
MSEKLNGQTVSRRKALSLIGIVLGLAASPLTESEADAQEAAPAPAAAPAANTGVGTANMKHRQGRRRSRRNTRHGRREERHGKPAAPATTAPATTPQ